MSVPKGVQRKTQRAGALSLLAILVATGCGSTSDSSSTGTSSKTAVRASSGSRTTLKVAAHPSKLSFDKHSLSAKAGTVTIKMLNPSPLPHNVGITGPDLPYQIGPTVGTGGTSTVTAKLKPGTYEFFCAVAGHQEGGMVGKLTVH